MENSIKINVSGRPIAKKRPQFARRGKYVVAYNDQQTEEGTFFLQAKSQVPKKLTGPITVYITFLFERPKSNYGTGRNQRKLKPSAPQVHDQKPDLDNMVKFSLDVLKGLAWDDDAQICAISAVKYGPPFQKQKSKSRRFHCHDRAEKEIGVSFAH